MKRQHQKKIRQNEQSQTPEGLKTEQLEFRRHDQNSIPVSWTMQDVLKKKKISAVVKVVWRLVRGSYLLTLVGPVFFPPNNTSLASIEVIQLNNHYVHILCVGESDSFACVSRRRFVCSHDFTNADSLIEKNRRQI